MPNSLFVVGFLLLPPLYCIRDTETLLLEPGSQTRWRPHKQHDALLENSDPSAEPAVASRPVDNIFEASYCGSKKSFPHYYERVPGGCSQTERLLCPTCNDYCATGLLCEWCVLGEGGFGKISRVQSMDGFDWAAKEAITQQGMEEIELFVQSLNLPFNGWIREFFADEIDQPSIIIAPVYDGGDLVSRIHTNAWKSISTDLKMLRGLFAQVAYGLWELHQQGIVHSDIKPENIMFRDKNSTMRITLIDYGLAASDCDDPINLETGCVNGLRGTIRYMSPRMIANEPHERHGYEVDWWSFGVTLYEIQTQTLPFGRYFSNETEMMDAVTHQQLDLKKSIADDQELLQAFHGLLSTLIGDKKQTQLIQLRSREAMQGPKPEEHPILSHDFWIQGNEDEHVGRKQKLRNFWEDICMTYAQATERGEPLKKCRRSTDESQRMLGQHIFPQVVKCASRQSSINSLGDNPFNALVRVMVPNLSTGQAKNISVALPTSQVWTVEVQPWESGALLPTGEAVPINHHVFWINYDHAAETRRLWYQTLAGSNRCCCSEGTCLWFPHFTLLENGHCPRLIRDEITGEDCSTSSRCLLNKQCRQTKHYLKAGGQCSLTEGSSAHFIGRRCDSQGL